jgi:hypothetical protein
MSLSWGSKRKLTYLAIFSIILIIGAMLLLWPYFNRPPTCFDGKQNGDESGVDCGGSCAKVCSFEAYQLVTLWSRAFPVTDGVYNLMAYVENQNRESGVSRINYEFRAYDQNNVFLGRKEGSTFVGSNDRTAIFESGFEVGNREPYRVDFQFTSVPVWTRINREQRNALAIDVQDRVLSNISTSPKLEATVINNTLIDITNLDVYVILYDESDNVINVSKTFIPRLIKNSRSSIVFTWPRPLVKNPSRIDILPQVNIFELGI